MENHKEASQLSLPLNRIEAFSDGVIAIVVTILVLEFKVPHLHGTADVASGLRVALFSELPKFASYLISFLVLSVWWVAHHHLLHQLRQANRTILWLNTIFLMFLAVIPFPTGLIGEYPDQPLAAMLYGLVCFATGLSFLGMRIYIRNNRQLVKDGISEAELRRGIMRGSLSPILYALASGIALYWPIFSFGLFALIPIFYVFPNLIFKK